MACFYFKNNLILHSIRINLNRRIICYGFMFFNDAFKMILYIWNRIWSMRQIKFTIPSWSRYFKFIGLVCRFNIYPCLIMRELANAIFLSGSLRLNLSANVNLNLWGLFILLFSVFIKMFPFSNSIDQIIKDCFG